ncbi:putative glycosyltransferase At3g07620 [Wolffia australiana]
MRIVLLSGILASIVLIFHTITLPPRNSFSPEFFSSQEEDSSSFNFATVGRLSLLSDSIDASPADEQPLEYDADDGDDVYDDLDMADADDPDDESSSVDAKSTMSEEKIPESLAAVVFNSSSDSRAQDANLENASQINYTDHGFLKLPTSINNTSLSQRVPVAKRRAVPTTSVQEMTNILIKNYAAYHSMRPLWHSPRDQELVAVKKEIEKAPPVKHDEQLYLPAFRNFSRFIRSYQLMERTLKVYVYSEGKKPIFHQPILKGIYASEGWFMKLMESSRKFLVRDPRRAHLFYLPFSSRHLQFVSYVPGSHNRTSLRVFLQQYVTSIASKYPFWNRTGGSDHFLVACHDWAPYETIHTMGKSFRALCNADLANGFRLGRDVSLPETYVRSAREPQRDLGGAPADGRPILVFYAGNLHGYLRPIILQHWENKDPDMRILGPMPHGVQSKMTYIEHMKKSKFCLCPRGYEVNSPRIVEAIFYECVPVIISDNYVPPFFEVLDWSAFSVFIEEKQVPYLKQILLDISEDKFQALQLGVRRVQRHFLWHSAPVKYDLFHMTLHSIWYNRVMNARVR